MSAYTPPDDACIRNDSRSLLRLFTDFANRHAGGFVAGVHTDMDALFDCALRVHQREHYFKIFHDMPKGLSGVKRISLYCFWLLKYKPFILIFGEPNQVEENVDARKWKWRKKFFLERFCIYLLTMIIRMIYNGVPRLPLSDAGIEDFTYSLKHHDVTKEVLTAMFEMVEDVVKLGHETVPQPKVFK